MKDTITNQNSRITVGSTANNSFAFDLTTVADSGMGEGGSEVVSAYDGRLFTTNGAGDAINVYSAGTGDLDFAIDLLALVDSTGYDVSGVQSVSAGAGGIAAAVNVADGAPGFIAFFDHEGNLTSTSQVGHLPDMVKWSHDGSMVFVANEGEQLDGSDPAGSISIIDVATGQVQTFGFEDFDDQADALVAAGVRLFPGELPSNDFEPEYIAQGADGRLYVTLQEANAVAVFDLETMAWADILPLGTVDHSVDGFGIDPSDRDDAINIHTVPVQGLRMPDAIATAEIDGATYFLTANEGDDRGEDMRIGDIVLDPTMFPDADTLQENENLGRLGVSSIDGDTDGDGDYDALYSYGSRSFTIFDASGNVVFDSGDDFETIIAERRPANAFNNDDYPSDEAGVIDENRSDNKGPEPEAIATGQIGGRTLAFVGLERDSGLMVYDITDPANATFVEYIDSGSMGHISPEVIDFITAENSLTGRPQIAVSFEVSGTTAVFDLGFGQDITGSVRADDISGSLADDMIFAGNGFDTVMADGGNDVINGAAGSDYIDAGAGDDLIYGSQSRDTIVGGTGNDTMNGGTSRDTFVFDLGDGQDRIVNLERIDTIDLSATGLSFDDLTISNTRGRTWLVEYGDQGDLIEVVMDSQNPVLNENDFFFGV